ncbi:MAG: TRAP transporter large permease subunit, partial [Pseudomonadota bacterium]
MGGDAGPPSRALGALPPQQLLRGPLGLLLAAACGLFAAWHLYVLNIAPMETWAFRISHVAGALALGFVLSGPSMAPEDARFEGWPTRLLGLLGLALIAAAGGLLVYAAILLRGGMSAADLPGWILSYFGPLLAAGTLVAMVSSWIAPIHQQMIRTSDWALALASIIVAAFFLIALDTLGLRLRAGTPFADPSNSWAALVGVALIMELTRRLAGPPLVIIAAVFVAYAFLGPYLPGFLSHAGYTWGRFFSYIYTDNGILGPTTAVSSTYLMLFITFAAFLQVTKVGEYFVDFSFALVGRARGGPAKVAVFASGLMGTINGTSAGNVVATGSITIPLMKKVGYKPQTAAAIE